MPAPALKKLAHRAGVSISQAEHDWKKAKSLVHDQYGYDEDNPRFWALTMGITKKMLKLKESFSFKEFIEAADQTKKPEVEVVTPNEPAIYVMRHGRTVLDDIARSDGWLDFPLSDEGRRRLITAQQYLKDTPLTKIYVPTLRRTTETGQIIQSGVITHPEIIPADKARTWDLGTLMGTPKKPNKPIVTYFIEHPDDKPSGGESLNQFRGRFLPWLEERMQEVTDGGGPILLVCSGSNLRELGTQLYGDKNVLDLDEGGLMVLTPGDDGWDGQVIFGHKDEDNGWIS